MQQTMVVSVESKSTDKTHVVSLLAEKHTHSRICKNDYFSLTLSVDNFSMAERPKIVRLQWTTNLANYDGCSSREP